MTLPVATERLYYDDSSCREFEATIRRVETRGMTGALWLNRSAFYPTSGGQPFDTGSLSAASWSHPLRVIEVVDEDDDVVHVVAGVEGVDLRPGQTVRGVIDWERRFDHMQQHTGQHILSAAVLHVSGAATVSFHLGQESSTIDLARELGPDEIARAEDAANEVVWENTPVTVRYADAAEAAGLGLRKPSARAGTLRLIEIAGHDLSACGGSHASRTGEVGIVTVRGWDRFKGGQRLEFLCGGRALRSARRDRDEITSAARALSVGPGALARAIEHLRLEAREHQKAAARLRAEVSEYRAEALLRQAEVAGGVADGIRRVLAILDLDAAGLQQLASGLVRHPRVEVVLLSKGSPASLVVARSPDGRLSCDRVIRALIDEFGGRGGGRPDFAQAGNLTGPSEVVLDRARFLLAPVS